MVLRENIMEEAKISQATIDIIARTRWNITKIIIFQSIAIIVISLILLLLNTNIIKTDSIKSITIINSSLFGLLGTLIYFSRKCYVYLIENKFGKLIREINNSNESSIEYLKNILTGYYLYLTLRPIVGVIIGPLIYMLVVTGLVVFIKGSIFDGKEISQSGRLIIYLVSFLGGHTSSDLLDRLSKFAKQIVIKPGPGQN